jgi:hypothetical protein
MLSEDFPTATEQLSVVRTIGAPSDDMSKLSIFDPNAIEDTGFGAGRHNASPSGYVRLPPRDELMLLHYKYIGFARTLARHREQAGGLGATDRANRWGYHYEWDEAQLKANWDELSANAQDIALPHFHPWQQRGHRRWWRENDFSDAPPRLLHSVGLRSRFLRL